MKLKIESLALTAFSLAYSLFRGSAKANVVRPETIAVAHLTTNIGDMIMATPVFRAVKKAHPYCRVVVVSYRKNKEVLAGNSDVDEYVFAHDIWEALQQVRRMKPDLGVAVNPSPHEIALLYLSGAKGISVFSNKAFQGRAYRALLPLTLDVPYTKGAYVPREYLKLLEPFGIRSAETAKHLAVSDDEVRKVRVDLEAAGIARETPFAVFAPGAGQSFREWPIERFIEVAAHASRTYGAGIAVAGGPSDAKFAAAMKDGLSGVPVFDGTTQTIEELKALVSLARVVVGNDSGIPYMAEAFGVPAVIITGVSDPNEHPKGSPLAAVVVPDSMPYMLHSLISDVDAVDEHKARQQFDAISPASVIQAFDSRWNAVQNG